MDCCIIFQHEMICHMMFSMKHGHEGPELGTQRGVVVLSDFVKCNKPMNMPRKYRTQFSKGIIHNHRFLQRSTKQRLPSVFQVLVLYKKRGINITEKKSEDLHHDSSTVFLMFPSCCLLLPSEKSTFFGCCF